ncbi:MAG: ComEA family DNA-binding protein [Christensenellales bacterium]
MRRWLEGLLTALCVGIAALCLALWAGLFASQPLPRHLAAEAAPQGTGTPAPAGVPINTADEATLDLLPGISPHIADLIVEARKTAPFYYVEDLKAIPGIGDKRVEALRPLLRFD